jgi:hypothetical protein
MAVALVLLFVAFLVIPASGLHAIKVSFGALIGGIAGLFVVVLIALIRSTLKILKMKP